MRAHSEHPEAQARQAAILQRLRTRLGVPLHWQIALKVVCYQDMPDAFGSCTWEHLAYDQYTIRTLCSLSDEEAEWILCHELYELLLAPLAEFTWQQLAARHLPRKTHEELQLEHHRRRDQYIEWQIRQTLGRLRPLTLTAERHVPGFLHAS